MASVSINVASGVRLGAGAARGDDPNHLRATSPHGGAERSQFRCADCGYGASPQERTGALPDVVVAALYLFAPPNAHRENAPAVGPGA
jgi:hypothetical protein